MEKEVFFSGRILIPLPDDWFKINFDITISLLEILSLFKHRFAELLMIIILMIFQASHTCLPNYGGSSCSPIALSLTSSLHISNFCNGM
jgi:hypothetical protein